MDPFNPFPTNNNAPSTSTGYHSAYRGTSHQQDGNFSHFVRALDVSHLQGGYWRYRSVQDDCLAMTWGFEKPEDLLIAVETSTDCEEYDKITLLWIKGASDPNLRGVLSGTAAQHLRIIHEIRQLLGLPMSSRGQIPTYPISTDIRLKLYWDRIYERQSSISTVRPFDVVDQAMLSLAPPPPMMPRPLPQPLPQPLPPMLPQPLPTLPGPPPPMMPQPPRSTHLQYVYSIRPHHQYTNPYGPREVPAGLPTSTMQPAFPFSNPNAMAMSSQQPLPAYPYLSGITNAVGAGHHCMWCETADTHDRDCPFGNVNFKNDLTDFDYHVLTDAVEQFDPGPWTTHFDQFPEVEPEDPLTQIAGMAEVIRGEDSYKNDVKLQSLRDDHLIMLWALKTSKGVEVIDEQA